jgi:hypothetical protein
MATLNYNKILHVTQREEKPDFFFHPATASVQIKYCLKDDRMRSISPCYQFVCYAKKMRQEEPRKSPCAIVSNYHISQHHANGNLADKKNSIFSCFDS